MSDGRTDPDSGNSNSGSAGEPSNSGSAGEPSDSDLAGEPNSVLPEDPDLDQLMEELEALEEQVDDPEERAQVRRTMKIARRIPGSKLANGKIKKYTTRDMAETFVGSIVLSLPLLVEDGVFEIAKHFVTFLVGGVPVFFVANVAFIVLLTVGLIYWSDVRDVRVSKPILGIFPRRLVGVLGISFLTATVLMVMWGRTFAEDPGAFEAVAQITVIWAAAAFGGALGDILPGESRGTDVVRENLNDIFEWD